MKRFFISFVPGLLAALVGASPLQAATTDWIEVEGGAVRLISAGPPEDGIYMTGLEFQLEPGWHTYWRYPGEAGIPPQITRSQSDNLKDFEVLYPAPERYSDGFSSSIVYHNAIVLPIRVTPEDPGAPVTLAFDLFFGVCNDICVPGEASLSLELSPDDDGDRLSAKLIDRDLAAVPTKAEDDALVITGVTLSDAGDSLLIETKLPPGAEADLFAAAPAGSYIGLPDVQSRSEGTALWALSTRGLKSEPQDHDLHLVLKAGGVSVEHDVAIQPEWLAKAQ
ncbi:hypothetical protein FMN50_05130 [Rhodobacterales bacterium]|nr:hypothetical protein FMN50_05130 [Rhodobacterales bacterium]